MKAKLSAKESVKKYLIRHKKINQLTALQRFGTWRLSAIIFQLKKEGMEITSTDKIVTNRYGFKSTISIYHLQSK